MPNSSTKMSLDKFEMILRKAKIENKTVISLFNWTDPFISRDLHEYAALVKRYGLVCSISTTLSFKNIHNFQKALQHIDTLIISVSGFSQRIHEINHVGGNIEFVKKNIQILRELKSDDSSGVHTKATLRYLQFQYNENEARLVEAYANDAGLRFEILPAGGDPMSDGYSPEAQRRWFAERVRASAAPSAAPKHSGIDKACPKIFDHIPINADGDAFHCCVNPNYDPVKIGRYLDMSQEDILYRRFTHPVCNSCRWDCRDTTPAEKLLLAQALAFGKREIVENTMSPA